MKLSVSLSEDDVRALDLIAEERGLPSRSAVLQQAIREMRSGALADDYRTAFAEWDGSGDAALWDGLVEDGLDAPR